MVKKFVFLLVVLIVPLFFLTGCGGSTTSKKEVPTVKKGSDLQVGEVKWKVEDVQKEKTLGNDYTKTNASGIFLVVKVRAELTGNKSGTVDSNQFELIDNKNRTFTPNSEGQSAYTMQGGEDLFLKQVNPGLSISGAVVFDIPEDAPGLKLKIKDLRLASSDYGLVDLDN